MRKGIILFILAFWAAPLMALEAVKAVRVSASPEKTRLVFEVTGPIEHNMFILDAPARVVVDFSNATFSSDLPTDSGPYVDGFRYAKRGEKNVRIVLDTVPDVRAKSFFLEPEGSKGYRLVLDLEKMIDISARAEDLIARPFIVAIDAGHGGLDPGAIGQSGTQEKTVVLKIAQRLADKINSTSDQYALMVREADYTMGLRERTEYARDRGADLFISIHADGFHDSSVEGTSVYVLSDRGASSEAARWLAEKENKAELIGGISLEDKGDVLASVLLDLSQTAARTASYELANGMLMALKPIAPMHRKRVESAGFMVLKSPDIPSVLIETGFISNAKGERQLSSRSYQNKMAEAIYQGVQGYLAGRPLPFVQPESAWITKVTGNKDYLVRKGDTLSDIAISHHISVKRLKNVNALNSDTIKVGQKLAIPRTASAY